MEIIPVNSIVSISNQLGAMIVSNSVNIIAVLAVSISIWFVYRWFTKDVSTGNMFDRERRRKFRASRF